MAIASPIWGSAVSSLPGRTRTALIQSAIHLGCFAAVACWLAWAHPEGRTAIAVLFLAGGVGELIPPAWRGWYLAEAVFIAALASILGFDRPNGTEALWAVGGMIAAWWCLIPARPGWLPLLAALVVAELLLLGRTLTGPPLAPTIDPRLTAGVPFLVGLALLALALDAWLRGQRGARGTVSTSSGRLAGRFGWLRWAVLPAAAVALAGWYAGRPLIRPMPPKIIENQGQKQFPQPTDKPTRRGLDPRLNLDTGPDIRRDPTVCARLTWNDPARGAIVPDGMVYLRALALDRLEFTRGRIAWSASRTTLKPAFTPPRSDQPIGHLSRQPGGEDVVLRFDGSAETSLIGVKVDAEGNGYQAGLGSAEATYQVALDGLGMPLDLDRLAGCRQIPVELESLPWNRIERADWRNQAPETAAVAVIAAVRDGRSYALDLPPPDASPGGAIATFLFSDKAGDRRGHCQFFASATAVLLRRAGHATRCVVGFASDEFDGTSVTFRATHAHAWIEVAGPDGRWIRFDPTPGRANQPPPPIPTGPESTPTQVEETLRTAAREAARAEARRRLPFIIIVVLVGLVVLAVSWWRWRQRPRRDPRRAELDRRQADLFALARELGIRSGPATTLSTIVARLSERSRIDLGRTLERHLDARFGDGPLPEPWPLDLIRTAAARSGRAR